MFANGRPYLAIPGPSVIPDRVQRAMHRASPNIYTGPLVDMTNAIRSDLKTLTGTAGHLAMYIGNGHGAWEAALANVVQAEDRVLVLATGRFGHGWGEMAASLNVAVDIVDFGQTSPVEAAQVEAALRADTGQQIKAVLCQHVDTSTGILNDVAAIRAAMERGRASGAVDVRCDRVTGL